MGLFSILALLVLVVVCISLGYILYTNYSAYTKAPPPLGVVLPSLVGASNADVASTAKPLAWGDSVTAENVDSLLQSHPKVFIVLTMKGCGHCDVLKKHMASKSGSATPVFVAGNDILAHPAFAMVRGDISGFPTMIEFSRDPANNQKQVAKIVLVGADQGKFDELVR
jgi:hypothetical protein